MIHHVYACRSNLGDWLAARAIQSLLHGLPIQEHLCDTPFVPATARALDAASDADLVVIGGGGLFMDYFQPFWEAFEPVSRRLSFCIWGAGLCDYKNVATRGNRDLIRGIVSRSLLCSVRDGLTREWLGSAKIGEPVPCPSINLLHPAAKTQTGVLLHAVHYNTIGAEIYQRMCGLLKRYAADTGRVYREINNVIRAGDERAFTAGMEAYRNAEVIVSSRLHGCIISTALGRRVLAVSGDRKVEAFMNMVGLGQWVCEADRVLAALSDIESQPSPVEQLEQARSGNRSIARQVLELAASVRVTPRSNSSRTTSSGRGSS